MKNIFGSRLFVIASFFLIIGLFLWIRKCVDRGVERITGEEIIREGDELFGTWASKTNEGMLQFHLKRYGSLSYMLINLATNDTNKSTGHYSVLNNRTASPGYFPRICAISDNGDTLMNYYIQYVTPYNSTIDKYDRLILSPHSMYDTVAWKFYRLKK